MRSIAFTKMAGAGNDFVVIDNRSGALKERAKCARRLCDRKYSIGADGLILLEGSRRADVRMRILNPDGSEAEMCGNGVRCLARFAVQKRIARRRHSIETPAGIINAEVKGQTVKARMVDPMDLKLGSRIDVKGRKIDLSTVNTGVPHAVLVVNSLRDCDVQSKGRVIRFHKHFAPRGTNVDFITFKGGRAIEIRTYERGVEDETLACGTGSTAGALVAAALKGLKSPVFVHTHGGEVLKVYFSRRNAEFTDVFLEGKVRECFEGRVTL